MTIIAHISDLHLLEDSAHERRGASWLRLQYLTLGRTSSPAARRLRVRHLLSAALRSFADHLIITGDLTEDGTLGQFKSLADVLHESGWLPSRVTLVPGNHDLYSHPNAWRDALTGPLEPYAATSEEGAVIELPDTCIVPLSTAFHQHVMRAAGALSDESIAALGRWASSELRAFGSGIIAQHHPPRRYALSPIQWLDGLTGAPDLLQILEKYDQLNVLHGHTHRTESRPVRPGGPHRIFSVNSAQSEEMALRLYRVKNRRLWPEPVRIESMAPVYTGEFA
ncbi:MAG: metallophosphoesterase [Polyangiaceae bacterium]|nr:metallophosphoesterase [Polyangiaceae bacterium]